MYCQLLFLVHFEHLLQLLSLSHLPDLLPVVNRLYHRGRSSLLDHHRHQSRNHRRHKAHREAHQKSFLLHVNISLKEQ